MNKIYSVLIVASLIFTAENVTAQTSTDDGFSQLIRSSPGDATRLVQNYAEPLFKGFGTGLNSGWNNTAKTLGLLHVDLRITASAAFVPQSDKGFDVRNIGLSNHITPDVTTPTTVAPTFGGDKSAALPVLDINNDAGVKVSSFTMPKAIISVIPAPNIQLTIGLIASTDFTLRTFPSVTISNDIGSIGMIGFGLKHNFTSGGLAKVIPFDLALAVNYNHINYSKSVSVQPSSGYSAASGSSTDFSNQRIDAGFSGVNVQAIISKRLLFFTPFFSASYQSSTSNLNVLGNYPVNSTNPLAPNTYVTISDPVHINETSLTGMRLDLGFQMNLAILRIYASGSVGKYPSVNGGIGFGF